MTTEEEAAGRRLAEEMRERAREYARWRAAKLAPVMELLRQQQPENERVLAEIRVQRAAEKLERGAAREAKMRAAQAEREAADALTAALTTPPPVDHARIDAHPSVAPWIARARAIDAQTHFRCLKSLPAIDPEAHCVACWDKASIEAWNEVNERRARAVKCRFDLAPTWPPVRQTHSDDS